MKETFVFDIESDGLRGKASKIHCLVAYNIKTKEWVKLTDDEDIRDFFTKPDRVYIGHNIVQYDIPVIQDVLKFNVSFNKLVDTLGISWYLHSSKPKNYKHGLEEYGVRFGVPKPEINDWENLTVEEYLHRATEDVKINTLLWKQQQSQLYTLYEGNKNKVVELIDYITFKLDCFREHWENPYTLDIDLIVEEIFKLRGEVENRRSELKKKMPPNIKMGKKQRPKRMYKKDGSLSSYGESWMELLKENNIPPSRADDVEELGYVVSEEEPNPDSVPQVKDWLFSLGWKPKSFKYVRNKKTNEVRAVPQIKDKFDDQELCSSIKELSKKIPEIDLLNGYSTIKHRLDIYEGFIRDSEGGKLSMELGGFTNTFRAKHRVIVNLPKSRAPYAENIRKSLVCDEGYMICSSDLSGVEDNTKRHYIYKYDPEYVKEQMTEGFDAHIEIAILSGLISEEDGEEYKRLKGLDKLTEVEENRLSELDDKRNKGKTVNFSSTYKVGAKTLSDSLGGSLSEAKRVLDAYWKRNWAIKKFEEDCEVKTIGDQMWVKQPISGFWYSLRYVKDVFSTINQGSSVYFFDLWLMEIRKRGLKLTKQVHDEFSCIFNTKEISPEKVKNIVKEANKKVNDKLKLNVFIGCDTAVGYNYKEVH